jgi:phosphate transport system permease protein
MIGHSAGDGFAPQRIPRRLAGPVFAAACVLATLTGVAALTVMLLAIVLAAMGQQLWYDLRLIPSAPDASVMPARGERLIVVADVKGALHFRIFDTAGRKVVETDERHLPGRSEQVDAVRDQLEELWPPQEIFDEHQLNKAIAKITALVDYRPTSRPWHDVGGQLRDLFTFLGHLAGRGPSNMYREAGYQTGIRSSFWLLGLVALFALPVGVGAAVFLEEYTPPGRIKNLVQTNIANLAGVPSIVYGILGLALFVRAFGVKGLALGYSLWAGALTLGLLVLPMIVIATQESLRSVPSSLRHAALALGATRWQMVRDHVVPSALPGIMTGIILALSRAIGETAPILMVIHATSVLVPPKGPWDTYAPLPIEIYNYASEPSRGFSAVSAGGILILLALLLSMNAVAIVIRNRYGRTPRA